MLAQKKTYTKNVLITAAIVLMMIVASCKSAYAATAAAGPNHSAAINVYGIKNEFQIADYNNDIQATLDAAGSEATANKGIIVYVPSGKYVLTNKDVYKNAGYTAALYVPKNVVLVMESDTVISDNTSNYDKPFIIVGGSLYGGRFDCGKRSKAVIKIKDNLDYSTEKAPSGKQLNGNIEKAEVVAPANTGILAIGTKNVNIVGNIVRDGTNKNTTGISLLYGAKATKVSNNTIKNIGSAKYGSGISVTHSDVGFIDGNTITKVAGHGISTDSDQKGKEHAYCVINYVRNNTINGAKSGIWLEDKCQIVKSLYGNKITNCIQNGIGIEAYHAYNHSVKWSIAYMNKNNIYSNSRSNISIVGKYGKVKISNGNKITNCKLTNGISLDKGGKLYINGKNNTIKTSKGYGIYLKNRSYLSISGSNTVIANHRLYAIGLANKSRAVVKRANLANNRTGSVRIGRGSAFKQSGCRIKKIVRAKTAA